MGFQYGKNVFPIDATGQTSLLPVCDAALAKILDFLRFVIVKYAGDAIVDTVQVPATDNQAIVIQSAVALTVPIDPDTIARAEQFQFPLLCGWSKSTKYNQRTLNWTADVRTIGLAYIFPPLGAHQSILWTPALNSISQICNTALKAGFDVDYNSGERILIANSITAAVLKSADFGHYDFAGKSTPPYFPAWVAELELTEQQQSYNVGLDAFTGADVTVTHQSEDTVSTTVAANAAIGATSLQVASSAGFTVLDVVVIGEGTAREERLSVTAVPNATHLTLAAPGLVFAHTLAQADVVATSPVTVVSAKTNVG